MKQVGSDEARRRFRDLLDDAQRGEHIEVLRHGKPVAVLVPVEWYERIGQYEAFERMQKDPDIQRALGGTDTP